jgi:capsule polysaccharide export protein KpsE/RkpR
MKAGLAVAASKLAPLIEKLFLALLIGTCGFMVTYLRDINQSLDTMKSKVGVACEQISGMDASMKSLFRQMAHYQQILDWHESRLDKLNGG